MEQPWVLVDRRKKIKHQIKINIELDKLPQLIYTVLQRYDNLIPASFITKQVNLLQSVHFYDKHQIGFELYNCLNPYLTCYHGKSPPTLWALKYVKKKPPMDLVNNSEKLSLESVAT